MKTTHVVMVTDMSGSMHPLADEVRGGFNSYIAGLAKEHDLDFRVTCTLFDTAFIPYCTEARLVEVPNMTEANYMPRGMTALFDAVGKSITEFESKGRVEKGDRVLVVIQTDGHENSSREWTGTAVRDLIKDRTEKRDYGFVFLGAGADAWDQAASIGIPRGQTISSNYQGGTVTATMNSMTHSTADYARGATPQAVAASVGATTEGLKYEPDEEPEKDEKKGKKKDKK